MYEQQRVLELEAIPNKKASQIAELLGLLKKGSLGMVDAVFEYSFLLLTKFKGSAKNQQPIYLDQYCTAGMELQVAPQNTIQIAFNKLKSIFGVNRFIRRLSIAIEHVAKTGEADNYATAHTLYELMIKEDLGDYESRKRHLSLLKLKMRQDEYVDRLNSHVQGNPGDTEAWQQMGIIYQETANFHKAAYCYQELITINPRNDHYFVRLGEIFMTQGGFSNLKNAKDYFCYVIMRDDRNYRALWCLNRVCRALLEDHEKDLPETVSELYTTTTQKIKEFYSGCKNSKVTLDKFKF